MPDPTSERPSAMKRRARRLLREASAYASTLGGDAQREEKKRLRRADVARRARAEAEGLGQGCLAATSGAQPGFPQGGGTKGEGTGGKTCKTCVVPRICEKTANIHIHHHHRHATTMTVMLVPRRPASEIDTAWQLHGSMATLITLIFNTIHNGHGFWRRFM